MTDTGPTADDGACSLHQFALDAVAASRPRGRAQKGAPYAGLLLDTMLDDFRTGKASYDLVRRAIQFSRNERRQSPLLRTLHAMALRRLDALRADQHAAEPANGGGVDDDAIRDTDTHSLQGVSSYEPPAVSGGH